MLSAGVVCALEARRHARRLRTAGARLVQAECGTLRPRVSWTCVRADTDPAVLIILVITTEVGSRPCPTVVVLAPPNRRSSATAVRLGPLKVCTRVTRVARAQDVTSRTRCGSPPAALCTRTPNPLGRLLVFLSPRTHKRAHARTPAACAPLARRPRPSRCGCGCGRQPSLPFLD
ncbi:hypothetical protein FA95DRAFT_958063 [Auriscalpium vulgare]|uniref:Uncharacterized protein n=1 Tax=Auriscalpium vulgare TaxID=40419 RepID=A0ACB8RXS0_9AGAM|nr:hypothetical protein FA95DRAFT_958063 [Auriscalpium vulgare]